MRLELDRNDLMPEREYSETWKNERVIITKMGWRVVLVSDLRKNPMEQYADEIAKRIGQHENFPAYRAPLESWEDETVELWGEE